MLYDRVGIELRILSCILGSAIPKDGIMHWIPLYALCLLGLDYEVVQVWIRLLVVRTATTNSAHLYSLTALSVGLLLFQ